MSRRTNYERGADKERYIVKKAKEQGMIAFRTAQSRGIFDVGIIDPLNKTIRLIQCKLYKKGRHATPDEREAIGRANIELSGDYHVTFELLERGNSGL